jgi:hypothetical protein
MGGVARTYRYGPVRDTVWGIAKVDSLSSLGGSRTLYIFSMLLHLWYTVSFSYASVCVFSPVSMSAFVRRDVPHAGRFVLGRSQSIRRSLYLCGVMSNGVVGSYPSIPFGQ